MEKQEEVNADAAANAARDARDVDVIIEDWFKKHFHGWAGFEVSLYNHITAAKEDLKKLLI